MKLCSTEGCGRKHCARGLCSACYKKQPDQLAKARVLDANRYRADPVARKSKPSSPDQRSEYKTRWRAKYGKAHANQLSRESYERRKRITTLPRQRARMAANPAVSAAKNQARKASLARCKGTHTGADRTALFDAYGWRCTTCAAELLALPPKQRTLDHVVPITRGGRNSIDNLLPMCGSCNSRKCNRC